MIEKRLDGRVKAPWLRCRGCHKTYWAENWHCVDCHNTFAKSKEWTTNATWHTSPKGCIPARRMGWDLIDDVWTER